MRKRRVPLPCAQEIAALRRKRVQPSFLTVRKQGRDMFRCPPASGGRTIRIPLRGGIEVRPWSPWSFRVFFRIALVDCPEKSVASLIRQKSESQIFHHVLNFD